MILEYIIQINLPDQSVVRDNGQLETIKRAFDNAMMEYLGRVNIFMGDNWATLKQSSLKEIE